MAISETSATPGKQENEMGIWAKALAFKHYLEPVRRELARVDVRIRQQAETFDPGLVGYVEYATETSGKRLRPALVLMTASATGSIREEHIDLATVIELIHLASLIHDDVLDQAELRRSRPTMNSKWGTEISVLLGDCLFAHALKLSTALEDRELPRQIADAANEVCTGEILQTQRRYDLKLSVAEYLRIIGMKTAALFRVSTELSARLNGAPTEVVQAMRTYGETLGIAYQIYDDCLDLFGAEEKFGKTLGTDLRKGKFTLPMLHLIQQLDGPQLEQLANSLLHGDGPDPLQLRGQIIEAGGHTYSVRKAQELLERAARAINSVPDSGEAGSRLVDFVREFSQQIGPMGTFSLRSSVTP